MQMQRNIADGSLATVFKGRPNRTPIRLGEPIEEGNSFAMTFVQSSFTQGSNPLFLQYTNTTLWCGESREAAAPLIARAIADAENSGGVVLEAPAATVIAPSTSSDAPASAPAGVWLLLICM
jgi:hypothetical protein